MENQPRVLLLRLCFRAPWCRSLKDRRSEVSRLVSRLKHRFNVSAVESGPQDIHTLFEITVAALAFGANQADSIRESLLSFAEEQSEAELYQVEENQYYTNMRLNCR